MTYKILSTRQAEEILFTTVEYNFNGDIHTIEVGHFMPNSETEIETNIVNRASSEIARIAATNTVATLIEGIVIGEEKTIE